MAYCTKQDLIDRFGERELIELTDRVNKPVSTINEITVLKALDDAQSFANGYLAKAIALPLDPVPDALNKIVADIARYYLHGKSAEKDGAVARNYGEAVTFLRDVSRGLVVLVENNVTPPPAGGARLAHSEPNRVFTRDSLRGL